MNEVDELTASQEEEEEGKEGNEGDGAELLPARNHAWPDVVPELAGLTYDRDTKMVVSEVASEASWRSSMIPDTASAAADEPF